MSMPAVGGSQKPRRSARSATPEGDAIAAQNRGRAWGINAPGAKKPPRGTPVNVRALPAHKDTPQRLLVEVMERRLDPKSLTAEQRQACLLLMANGKHTSTELAELFGVSAQTIRKDISAMRTEVGREVRTWTAEEILGRLAIASEKYQAMALKVNDPGLAWAIERDTLRLLKELGLITSGTDKTVLTLTLEGIGENYERAQTALAQRLNPALMGVVDTTPPGAVKPAAPALPLPMTTPEPPQAPPQVSDVFDE